MKNKITLEDENGIYSVEFNRDEDLQHIGKVINYLVRPVLRAAGYADSVIDKHITEDEDQW